MIGKPHKIMQKWLLLTQGAGGINVSLADVITMQHHCICIHLVQKFPS